MYKEKKQEYDKLLIESKKRYFANKIKFSDNKTKSTWSVVNTINGKDASPKQIIIKGDLNTVTNEFNNFFVTAASNILSEIENIPFTSRIG